jgi:PAS domain S-box-containing protein
MPVPTREAEAILLARQRAECAERELIAAREELERRSRELIRQAQASGAREDRLPAVFNQVAVGMCIAAPDGYFIEANRKACDILGYTLEELRARTFTSITHPEDLAETLRYFKRLMAATIPQYSLEKRYIRKDGSIVWSRTTVTVLKTGTPERLIGIIEDITQQKRAQQALADETRVLEMLNATGTAIAAQLDLHTLLQTVADAATQLSGAQFGAFFYNVVDPQSEESLIFVVSGAPRAPFEKLGTPGATPLFDATLRRKQIVRSGDIRRDPRYGTIDPHRGTPSGHPPVCSYLAVPVMSRSGEVIGALFFGHVLPDVFTERSERLVMGVAAQAAVAIDNARLYEAAQREIASRETAEAALRETDRRKDEFLATLAHELRNPLAPIRQAAVIANTATATDAQKRWSHEVISRQVHHMSLLLDDLLDISRITRGTLELRIEVADLASVITAAVETARPAIDGKHHIFTLDTPAEPVYLAADPLRLAQVLSNLLTNAAKYTDPQGHIRLQALRGEGDVSVRVIDSGIGIAPEMTAGVFQMFSQVPSGRDRSEGGLGIGLALAKGLVELHGGSIEARSPGLGFGSEFIVTLPVRGIEPPACVTAADAAPAPLVSRRVLIADDNCDAADSLAMLLRMEGHEVTVVHDGSAALSACNALQPEFVFLDIGMPGLNGYEVARRVRKGSLGRAMTLVAVTGWGQDSDKARALAAGFNHHFTKPVEPQRLSALLRG